MELVLPNNYQEINQEEMAYLDGGDWNNFRKNIEGLVKSSAPLRDAMRQVGLVSAAGHAIRYAQPILMAKAATLSAPIIAAAGVAGVAITAGVGLALWNIRMFY
ncbi:hypothetical protein [Enterococcus cecorum]|uniref:hypothetical protein n=1 Tax=Enterococcus cecorum TaxID=44008 RepID=UPI003F1FF663